MRIVTQSEVDAAKADWESKVDAPAISAFYVWKRLQYLHAQCCHNIDCTCNGHYSR